MHKQRGEPERLQKVLARAGLASRREAEDWIRAGRLTVNGQPASLGVRVGPDDEVRLDGRVVHQRAPQSGGRAYIYHRSPGESLEGTAHPPEAPESRARHPAGASHGATSGATSDVLPLFARLPKRGGRRFIVISPMPRIDGGLELICGDGELAARLQRSVRQLSSELSVRVRGELIEQQVEGILGGVLDSGEKLQVLGCQAAGGEGTNRWYSITARGASGKDVRQLFERQGAIVSRVLRTRLGALALERTLGRGHFRELAREELQALFAEASPDLAEDSPAEEPKRPRSPGGPHSRQPQLSHGRRSRSSPRTPVRRGRTRD
jgi:23S rRNA pseudouridine2605 synthase